MTSNQEQAPFAKPMLYRTNLALTLFLHLLIISPQQIFGISCFRCSSSDNSNCTKEEPSFPAVDTYGCNNIGQVFDEWFSANSFSKFGIGSINVESVLRTGTTKAMDAADLTNVPVCIYMYASNENVVTENVDKGIAQAKALVGRSDDGTTISRWVKRDCASIMTKKGSENELNKCAPVSGQQLFKLFLCICTDNKCNEGPEKQEALKKIINDVVNGGLSNSETGNPIIIILGIAIFSLVHSNLYL